MHCPGCIKLPDNSLTPSKPSGFLQPGFPRHPPSFSGCRASGCHGCFAASLWVDLNKATHMILIKIYVKLCHMPPNLHPEGDTGKLQTWVCSKAPPMKWPSQGNIPPSLPLFFYPLPEVFINKASTMFIRIQSRHAEGTLYLFWRLLLCKAGIRLPESSLLCPCQCNLNHREEKETWVFTLSRFCSFSQL